ncbi:MAG: hypothetical protein KME15_05270 [Drouetiella hepatica Uher 2000/2452]|uniref:Uncharacterized protein n=1 Tax=Drouetiella hepatica Uher 2000/2452 TaxID=904376 RepID=A0A951Q792_9CYAN|nr:hypothetical protein [Drouetiella hepatica Uher 2000/2452]
METKKTIPVSLYLYPYLPTTCVSKPCHSLAPVTPYRAWEILGNLMARWEGQRSPSDQNLRSSTFASSLCYPKV